MADVFISYKSDRRAAAEHLAEILADYGYSVWWDYALVSGSDFGAQIEREIRAAKAVIVLWCSLSRASEWVKEEAALAKRLNKIVPARIEDIELPLGFSMAQTIDLMSWDGSPHGQSLDRLLRDVGGLVGRRPKLNQDGLNRTERAWRRFGAPALSDFPLIDALERRQPARTLPSALRSAPHADRVSSPLPADTDEPATPRRAEPLASLSKLTTAARLSLSDMRLSPRSIGLLAAAAALGIGLWLGRASKSDSLSDTKVTDTKVTPPVATPPPATPKPVPSTSAPPAIAPPDAADAATRLTAPGAPEATDVQWNVCNKSSHDDIWVAVGYLADADLTGGSWTYSGWFQIQKTKCVFVARSKNTYLLVRAEAADGAFWGKDKSVCVLKNSNYLVHVAAGAKCPSDYETRGAFQNKADNFGRWDVSLSD